ncbi:hypothetical protein EDD22DRAFT_961751 [Suillus occidentalis]|nr:hypothetical protein EDD22DRAFT_961751 [Suillus occidentalis]
MDAPLNLDLTHIRGREVSSKCDTVTWTGGHKSILPMISDPLSDVNLCDEVDNPIIKFMARLPESTISSRHVLFQPATSLGAPRVIEDMGVAFTRNQCVHITGVPLHTTSDIVSMDLLDAVFGISPMRPVCIHDTYLRCQDHVKPTMSGTIMSFLSARHDPTVIQCILDIPLAQISLPIQLMNIDHGLVHGWNQTTHNVPITSRVHPENFTMKGWGLLSHAGFLTYPHHDAEGMLTWVRLEAGLKFWAIFRLRSGRTDRIHLQELCVKLANYNVHKTWIHKHCDGEVVTLRAGDIFIMPPGVVHAVYTPVASFATGGHFYHHSCMHLTELSRYIDAEVASSATNQTVDHALETLRRMVIMLPYLSTRVVLYKRSLLALALMASKGRHYRAQGSNSSCVQDTETARPSADICDVVFEFFGVTGRVRPGDILFVGNQLDAGDIVDRVGLVELFKKRLVL